MTEPEVTQMMAQATLIGCHPQPSGSGRCPFICGGGTDTAGLFR
jgi:hypothetical protein